MFSGGFDTGRVIKWFIIKNTSTFKAWMGKLAENSKIMMICVAHGDPILENAQAELQALVKRI